MSPLSLRAIRDSDSIDGDDGDADDDDLEFEENPFIVIEQEGW